MFCPFNLHIWGQGAHYCLERPSPFPKTLNSWENLCSSELKSPFSGSMRISVMKTKLSIRSGDTVHLCLSGGCLPVSGSFLLPSTATMLGAEPYAGGTEWSTRSCLMLGKHPVPAPFRLPTHQPLTACSPPWWVPIVATIWDCQQY